MMINVPYFDGAAITLNTEVDGIAHVLDAFLTLDSTHRLTDSRHVFAYYQDYRSGADWLDAIMAVPDHAQDIWKHVTPGPVYLEQGRRDDTSWYVVMEAECDWDVEHGLMMVWRNGTTLCKVGGYDSHLTNVNAFGDPALQNVVYAAVERQFVTFADKAAAD